MPSELTRLLLLVLISILGTLFSPWKRGRFGSFANGFVLLGISLTLLCVAGELSTGPRLIVEGLCGGLGLWFGLSFPCCAPRKGMGALQFAGFAVVLGHAVLDGHLVREATTFSLLFLLSIHKFMDGADARILSLDRTWDAWIARAALVIATPLGFFFVPVSVSGGLLDASLFATVIGLNLGSAFHLFKHALVAHHDHSPAVS